MRNSHAASFNYDDEFYIRNLHHKIPSQQSFEIVGFLLSVSAEYHVHRSCSIAWAWVNAAWLFRPLGLDICLYILETVFADCGHEITVRPKIRLPVPFF